MHYSVQPRDQIFVKGYGILSFTENMGKNTAKNLYKNLSGLYSQKILGHAKRYTTDALKTTSKKAIKKTAEATGVLIGNKIADVVAKSYDGRIMTVSRSSSQNKSETITNKHDKEIPKKRYISRRKTENY